MNYSKFSHEQLIKELEKLQIQLKKAKNNFNDFLNAIPEAAFLINANGKVIASNNITANRVKMNQVDFIGSIAYDSVPAEVAKHRKKMVNKVIQSKESVCFEDERKGKTINNCMMPVFDENGKVVRLAIIGLDITQRVAMEKELRKSEDRFLTITEEISDWIWQVDKSGIYTYSNAKVKDLLGYNAKEIVGITLFDLMAKDEAKRVKKFFKTIVSQKQIIENFENTVIHKKGNEVVLETNGVPFFDPEGNLLGYRGIDRDITERKKIEERIKKSESQYHDLYDNAPDMFVSVDAKNATIKNCNQTLADKLGYKKEEIIGKPVFKLYSKESIEYAKTTVFPKFQKTGIIDGEELLLQRKNGSTINVLLNVSGVRDNNGTLIESRSVWRDITELKRAEEALRKSEQIYKKLFENTGTATFVSEQDMTISQVNFKCEELSGYKKEEIVGKMKTTDFIPRESLERVLQYHSGRRKKENIPSEYEIVLLNKYGEEKTVYIQVGLIPETNQSIASVIDITSRKKSEEALKVSEEKFNKAFNAGPDFVSISRLRDGRYLDANENWLKITGYSREEIIGKTSSDLRIWANPANRDIFGKILREKGIINNFETYFRMKNGDIIPCQIAASIIEVEGEKCLISITRDITQRKIMEEERESLIKELQGALAEVKTLGGMLPICSSCKKIRDDKGYWNQIESYIREHSDAQFSHSICPDCAKRLYPEYYDENDSDV